MFPSWVKILVLPTNIKLDWKVIARYKHSNLFGLVVSNEVKKFYNIVTCGLYYKTFRIVIYDRNDSTIVEPVL